MKMLFKFVILHSFSSPVDLIQALVSSIVFSFAQCFSNAGAPHNHSPLAIHLFRSAQDIPEIRVSTLNPFKLF